MVFKSIVSSMRIKDSIFLSGIPLFGFLYGVKAQKAQWEYTDIILLLIASLLCASSVFVMGRYFEGNRNKIYIIISIILILISSATAYYRYHKLALIPSAILLNWFAYHTIRKKFYIFDILLHISGGMLAFLLGLLFSVGMYIPTKEIYYTGLFIAFAFTGGYMIDLIEDIEEDKREGKKNLAEKFGIFPVHLISLIMFSIAYFFAFLVLTSIRWLIISLVCAHLVILITLTIKKVNLHLYRQTYRVIFIIMGVAYIILH